MQMPTQGLIKKKKKKSNNILICWSLSFTTDAAGALSLPRFILLVKVWTANQPFTKQRQKSWK